MNNISVANIADVVKIVVWFILIIFDLIMVYAFLKKRKEKEKGLKLMFPLLAGLVFTSGWIFLLWIAKFSFCCGVTNLNLQVGQ